MSTPFTAPAGQTWQTLLTELTTAYSERRQAIGQSIYTPEAGRNVQSAAYWAGLQDWLETNCTAFVDHENGPLTDAGDEFLSFTLETWRAVAAIPQDGFRRSTDGSSFSYGAMQAGDAIGPWIFEDLQKGFGALGQTTLQASFSRDGENPQWDQITPEHYSMDLAPLRENIPFDTDIYADGFRADDYISINGVEFWEPKYASNPEYKAGGLVGAGDRIYYANMLLYKISAGQSLLFDCIDSGGGGWHSNGSFRLVWSFTNQ